MQEVVKKMGSNFLIEENYILELFHNIKIFGNDLIIDKVENSCDNKLKNNELCFYRINKLSFDEDYPHREAFENVLFSLDNEAFNFVYILTGTKNGIDLCIGVVKNNNENKIVLNNQLSASNYGEIIANVFEGNFNGSNLERLKKKELEEFIIEHPKRYKNAGVIMGIPSVSERQMNDGYDFQGIDRLINSMLGLEWRVVVVCEPVNKSEILKLNEYIYELYNSLSAYSKMSLQKSSNFSDTISVGKNTSDSRGKNRSYNDSKSFTDGEGNSSGTKNSSKTNQKGTSNGISEDHTQGKNYGYNINKGSSESITIEIANKHTQEIMNYIDESLLERFKVGFSKGLFKTSVYYMAEEPNYANRLKVGLISLFQGNKSNFSPLINNKIDLNNKENYNLLNTYKNHFIKDCNYPKDLLMLLSRPYNNKLLELSTYLTTEEVSLVAGLPQKEVPGLYLNEGVNFGLNQQITDVKNGIKLGTMVQRGRILKNNSFFIDKDSLKKHTFIAGVTGSGKTTTCHKLLSESEVPFLVIEPAKTEYRQFIKSKYYEDILVFTLGNESVAPFRINPFELIEGEIISAHVDMLKATFTSAFPMEASMPQILEEAIYSCYRNKGWNISTNKNDIYGDRAFDNSVDSFPILSELLVEMENVIKEKKFSMQMESDYRGSLISRLSNLTVGSKGSMLNCKHSIDFNYLINNNVILEMEELKSPEDKALLMGLILSRLVIVIKNEYKKNKNFKHLTLIEEAHRLLAKVEYGDSGSKKVAVETFTDLLAEIRKYGEGLIIVDQIPNKLASEVLKNTNTKIIHKILARDDKDAVGDTMMMNDKQKEFLSALEVGNVIVFSENTDKPIHVKVESLEYDTLEIDDEYLRKYFLENKNKFGKSYYYFEIVPYYNKFEKLAKNFANGIVDNKECKSMKKIVENISQEYDIQKYDIWKKFVEYKFLLAGIEVKIDILLKFFNESFYKDDFGKKYLSDLKLRSYLK